MLKVMNLRETDNIKPIMLRAFIAKKITAMMNEYSVDTLDDIGCFVVLEKDEISAFVVSEMEFVEVLEIGEKYYLHGAKILGDSYGEDIYLPVEVVRK
ncbi:MAG TPA: hypothetical protein P5092_00175 [Ruminococcus sp.]|nr:hypothetical protein [Ruminococcus sp.]